MELPRWRQCMREMQLLGQVTGPLANSVLKTAYVRMLPRSVARVMFDLSQLIAHFVESLRALEGGAAMVDADRLRLVFQTYLEDVQRRVVACARQHEPSEAEVAQLAVAKCAGPVVFDDADSAELNEKYWTILAREATAGWQQAYGKAVAQCCEEASRAHQKWQRSIDHYLMQGGVDAATKQRVLLDSQKLRLAAEVSAPPLATAERDRLVLQHAQQVPVAKSKQLFQRTRLSFTIEPAAVAAFLLDLRAAWALACEAEVARRCIQPVQANFDQMIQGIEDLNARHMAGAMRPGLRQSFDFSFAHRLAELLPRVASFDAQQEEADDAIGEGEADRCERFCEEVRATLRDIRGGRSP